MAFISNSGSTASNPFTSLDRYIQLAHPSLADVLLLNEMTEDGSGYQPSKVQGLLTVSDRTLSSVAATQASYKKLVWQDLAFVMTLQQWGLFSAMLLAQSPASPVTVQDKIADPVSPLSKLVIIEMPNGPTVFGSLKQYLAQFSLVEI